MGDRIVRVWDKALYRNYRQKIQIGLDRLWRIHGGIVQC